MANTLAQYNIAIVVMTFSITMLCNLHHAECPYTECHILLTVMLSDITLSVVMLNVVAQHQLLP